MASSLHSIRSQTLDVAVATERLALALQPRLGELNRRRLLPVIDRVLGEFDEPGRHVRIDRLVVDLGVLPLSNLDERAEAALEQVLREAIAAALSGLADDPDVAAAQVRPEGEARLALLEHYLIRGTLPFWAQRAAFSADALVAGLATAEPASLAALIRRHGRHRHVLDRLVLQLAEPTLRSLLALLEPAHAALIIVYMLDLRQIHDVAPLLPLGDAVFARLLWRLTLSYLLREAGSHFNRKSFVRALLAQIAADESVPYPKLAETLARGLRATERRRPLASSLPAVIDEIVHELKQASPELTVALASDPAALAGLVRRHSRDRAALERLVAGLDEAMLEAVLALLEPVHAALIMAYMIELRQAHRAAPLAALDEPAFAQLLWVVSFAYLVHEAGSQFNRRSYVRALLEEIAAGYAVTFEAVMTVLVQGLRATERHLPHAVSLPAIIDEIVDDLGIGRNGDIAVPDTAAARSATPDPAALADLVRHHDRDPAPLALADFIRRHGHDRQALERLVRELDEDMLQATLRLLEPVHASLIIAYMVDLRQVHRAAPRVTLDDAPLARLLWTLTFSYVTRDAGSQFNRKSYLRTLLTHMAVSLSMGLPALASTLQEGLRTSRQRQPLASSLPAVMGELLDEFLDDSRDESLSELAGGAAVANAGAQAASDPALLAERLRREPPAADPIVRAHDERTLQAVLRELAPRQADMISAAIAELRRADGIAPLTGRDAPAFARMLWAQALAEVAGRSGAPFDIEEFIRRLLERVAAAAALPLADLLARLARDLAPPGEAQESSLPAVVAALVGKRDDASRAPQLPGPADEEPRDVTAQDPASPDAAGFDAARRVLDRYDRIDALRHLLRHGFLAPDVLLRRGDLTAEVLAEELSRLDGAQIHALLAAEPAETRHALLLRAVRMLGPARLAMVWRRLLARPASAEGAGHVAAAREAFTAVPPAEAASGDVPFAGFGDTLFAEALAAAGAAAPDPDALHARLLQALIEGEEIDLDVLAAPAPMPDLVAPATGDTPVAWPMQRIEAELLTRLRAGASAPDQAAEPGLAGPELAELIAMLLDRHPADAARLLKAIASSTALTATLAKRLDGLPPALRQRVAQLMEAEPAVAAPPSSAVTRDAVFGWLAGDVASQLAEAQLRSALPDVAAAFPQDLARFVADHAGRTELRARWIATLSDSALARLAYALEPVRLTLFLDALELIHRAAFAIADAAARQRMRRAPLWDALIAYLAAHAAPARSIDAFVATLLASSGEAAERVRAEARRLAAAGRPRLLAALARPARPGAARSGAARRDRTARPSPASPPGRARTAFNLGDEEVEGGEPVYIDNAGLALAGVFLPHLFERLDLLARDDGGLHMRDPDAASRAVHLLQYLVDGRCDAPEPALVLNKLLCGLPTATAVAREITPTADELALCDSLLRTMIARWEIIKDSSVAALRETFLQREGKLTLRGEAWTLQVQRKTVDVLLDRIPWSISVVYHAWMPRPLHVTW